MKRLDAIDNFQDLVAETAESDKKLAERENEEKTNMFGASSPDMFVAFDPALATMFDQSAKGMAEKCRDIGRSSKTDSRVFSSNSQSSLP